MQHTHVQISLSQRAGSATLTITATRTHPHTQQALETVVRKANVDGQVLEDDALLRQLVCYVERAMLDLQSPLPF